MTPQQLTILYNTVSHWYHRSYGYSFLSDDYIYMGIDGLITFKGVKKK